MLSFFPSRSSFALRQAGRLRAIDDASDSTGRRGEVSVEVKSLRLGRKLLPGVGRVLWLMEGLEFLELQLASTVPFRVVKSLPSTEM